MWNVRELYLSLIADSLDDQVSSKEIRDRRDALQSALHKLYLAAPFTDDEAYAKAQKLRKDNEELMFSEKEIHDMLPKQYGGRTALFRHRLNNSNWT